MTVLKRILMTAVLGVALIAPATAQASTIPYDCSACGNHNTAFDITYSVINAATNTYELKVTAIYDAPGAGLQDYTYINAIALKIDGITYENGTPTLTAGPDGGPWMAMSGGLNSTGCSGSGTGYFCADSAGMGAAHFAPGSPDTWKFVLDLTAPLGSMLTVKFKGHFTDADGGGVGTLISDDFLATETSRSELDVQHAPEPASLVLFGGSLVFLAARLRRKRKLT
jgi:PEP-CTERM motif